MLSKQEVQYLYDYEVLAYFIDGDSIYAKIGEEVVVYPNNEHNLALCHNQVMTKIKITKEVYEDLVNFRKSKKLVDRFFDWCLKGLVQERYQYLKGVCCLYDHLDELQQDPDLVIQEVFSVNGVNHVVESPIAVSNLFVLEDKTIQTCKKLIKQRQERKEKRK